MPMQVEDNDGADGPPHQRRHHSESEGDETDSSDHGGSSDQVVSSADDELAKKLVRYAISCEYSRTAIRRDGIKERGLLGPERNLMYSL